MRGPLTVGLVEAARPGARVILMVNGVPVIIPPDPPQLAVVRADPTPVAVLEGGVLWALLEATGAADAAPAWSVPPGLAAFGCLAVWSRRAVTERGEGAYESMIGLSACAALAQAIAVHAATRGEPDRPDGTQRTPMQAAMNAPTVLVGFCWPSLSAGARWRVAGGFVGLAAIGVALLERPRWRLDLIRNALWLPALFAPSVSYSLGGEREARRARDELHVRHAAAADDAARQGEKSEWERILAACAEGLASLDAVDSAARADVGRRLSDLHCLAKEHLDAYQ